MDERTKVQYVFLDMERVVLNMNFLTGLKVLVGGLAGYQLLSLMKKGTRSVLRPPGASDEDSFLAQCIRCDKCVQACPHDVIKVGDASHGVGIGTPYIVPREGACQLCEDFPCVEVCPTEALSGIKKVSDVKMGVAVLDRENCIALKGNRCEVCYRACPLIDQAITINYKLREGDNIHTIFEPIINKEYCVGCGICEERCVVSEPVAIRIKPREIEGLF